MTLRILECLTRDVEGKIFRVNDTLDEVQIFRDKVFAVVHVENAANIERDVVALLLCLEEIERCTKGHEINVNTLRSNQCTIWERIKWP